jgi:ATP-dependent RNA helicase RhlB
MLFSATLSYRVMELAYEHMNLPEKISITPEQVTVEKVEQVLYHVGKHEKVPLLLGLLQKERPGRALIFVNTRRAADMVVERLNRNNWKAQAITGDIEQKKRLRILADFKEGRLPILVATDVASRGIDVKDITHVINYDLPQDAEDYVHRIGRTGRAGATGKALSLADEEYVFSLEAIEAFIGQKIPVEWADGSLYVREIRRTHEERQKSEQERASRPPQPARRRTSDRSRPRR